MDSVLLATLAGAVLGGLIGSVSAHVLARRAQAQERRHMLRAVGAALYLEAVKMRSQARVVYTRDPRWHFVMFDTAFHDAFPNFAHLFDPRTAIAVIGAQQTVHWLLRKRASFAPTDSVQDDALAHVRALDAKLTLELTALRECGVAEADFDDYRDLLVSLHGSHLRTRMSGAPTDSPLALIERDAADDADEQA